MRLYEIADEPHPMSEGLRRLLGPRIDIITEGLVALPPLLLANIRTMVFTRILWRMRDAAAANAVYQSPRLMEQVVRCAAMFHIVIPAEACESLSDEKVDEIPVPFEVDLPGHYPARRDGHEILTLRLEWAASYQQESGSVAAAAYDPDAHRLLFYLSKSNPKDIALRHGLRDLFQQLDGNIRHELRHGIQVGVLGDHTEQTARKTGYATDPADYFTSPIEFDPHIGSDIEKFVAHCQQQPPINLANAMRSFVGMPKVIDRTKPSQPSMFLSLGRQSLESSAFFHYLKIKSPKRYKIAVRKFVIGVQHALADKGKSNVMEVRPSALRIFRGEYSGNKGGFFWTQDREFARQFTQSGRDHEILVRFIYPGDIYMKSVHVYAGDEVEVDAAIAAAKVDEYKAVMLSEGPGQPNSIYVFDKTALLRS